MRLFWILSIALLIVSSQVSGESEDYMRMGLETLLERESLMYQTCIADKDEACDFDEVYSYLKLLDLWDPVATKKLRYPRSAQEAQYAGVVKLSLTVEPDGSVSKVKSYDCESGKGDPLLRFQWEVDGRYCAAFKKAAEKALLQYRFSILPESLHHRSRVMKWQAVFQLKSLLTYLSLNAQVTDLSAAQAKQLRELSRSKNWTELERYALDKGESSPVFMFYAAEAAWGAGNKKVAIQRYRDFLKNGGHSYWHFGVKAAILTIGYLYDQADDEAVISVNYQALLQRYLREGNAIGKPLVAEALLKYASSLTMVEDPKLGRAVLILRGLQRYLRQSDDIPDSLRQMINAELANYESQIIAIGRSKVEQPQGT